MSNVFPAYAGMIPKKTLKHNVSTRVPRIRGDDPDSTASGIDIPACSPHTRG